MYIFIYSATLSGTLNTICPDPKPCGHFVESSFGSTLLVSFNKTLKRYVRNQHPADISLNFVQINCPRFPYTQCPLWGQRLLTPHLGTK